MKLLKVFNGDQQLFIDENNKKYKKNLNEINKLINQVCIKYNEYSNFLKSQSHTENISLAKGLIETFTSKKLRLDLALDNLRKNENDKINEFNSLKSKLINELNIVNNPVEAVVSLYSIEGNEFKLCENGKELVILGEHNNIINQVISMIEDLNLESNIDNVEPHQPTFNTSKLKMNTELCRTTAEEIYGYKQGKLNKILEIVNKYEEVGMKVVSFYSYKERLLAIGCNPKFVKDYENEIGKMYFPLKKTLQKELKLELQEIYDENIDENSYNQTNKQPTDEYDNESAVSNENLDINETQETSDISKLFNKNEE